jgi:hypothetical protein
MVSYDLVELTGTTNGSGAATVQSKAENVTGEIVGVITDGTNLSAAWDLTLTAQVKDVAGTWQNVETIIGVTGSELASAIESWHPRTLDETVALVAGTAITPFAVSAARFQAVLANAGNALDFAIKVLVRT